VCCDLVVLLGLKLYHLGLEAQEILCDDIFADDDDAGTIHELTRVRNRVVLNANYHSLSPAIDRYGSSLAFAVSRIYLSCTTPPHSHSIILSDGNDLNSKRKYFVHTTKNRLLDPSEICALEFKKEFRRFRIWSVSATIGIDWSILCVLGRDSFVGSAAKRTVSLGYNSVEHIAMLQA